MTLALSPMLMTVVSAGWLLLWPWEGQCHTLKVEHIQGEYMPRRIKLKAGGCRRLGEERKEGSNQIQFIFIALRTTSC